MLQNSIKNKTHKKENVLAVEYVITKAKTKLKEIQMKEHLICKQAMVYKELGVLLILSYTE